MNYTSDPERKIKQIQWVSQAKRVLENLLDELTHVHSPNSGRSQNYDYAMRLLKEIDDE